jgi:hypothetical protein
MDNLINREINPGINREINREIKIRVCKKCNEIKKLDFFPENRHTCKKCDREIRKEYFKKYHKKNYKLKKDIII